MGEISSNAFIVKDVLVLMMLLMPGGMVPEPSLANIYIFLGAKIFL